MGEVRAKITLRNAVDEELARQGKLPQGKIRSCVVDALVDTGSVQTVLPAQVVGKLGLGTRGRHVVEYADGRREAVPVTGGVLVDWEGRDTLEEAVVLGDEVLIGQTVLEKLDLHVDCANQRLIPNPAHPDQPVTKVK
jgi:clan AA aspartic protease